MKEAPFDRVHVEEADFDVYLALEADDKFPLKNHNEIFLLSACIGYQFGIRLQLDKPKQLTGKTAVLNLEQAQIIYDAFVHIASKNGEIDDEGLVCVRNIMEEYAKGGFKKLSEEMLDGSNNKGENLANYMMLHITP